MPYRISGLDFSILSPEMIKNLARVRVVTSDLYDADGYPVEGGVMDPRMGVIDPGFHCRTCGGGIGECSGHFGYLELAKPIVHVLYTKVIYYLLRNVCRECGRIMTLDIKAGSKKAAVQVAKCPHCGATQGKITFVKPYTFYEEKTELSPVDIRERFEKIPDDDLKRVGIRGGRPEWLIMTLFIIPPVTMRPSITLESGERSEDDLTHKLVDIVRISQSLKENMEIGAPEFIINDLWELVQYHISTYYDNELTGVPLARHRSGRPLKGVIQRLKAKEGRIRGNLLGKRVNFSARTVISPDPMLSINEVGVPETVAQELTIPEYVTNSNIKDIRRMIKDGRVNYVTRPDGRRIKITADNKKEVSENIDADWIADRQIADRDVAVFNRQPSLHRISMMAHYVKITPYRTFRLNPSVCPPYNADFDGDEMNLHILQTEEARTEARELMDVKHNIISPKFGGPIIGLDLDQISGIYLLTKRETVMNREDASQLLADAGLDVTLPEKDMFTGKEIFSLLLPSDLNMEFESNWSRNLDISYEEKKKMDGVVVIKNGAVLQGVIDKNGIGAEKGKIISKLYKIYNDKDKVRNFIDSCGRLGIAFLMRRGFSIGLSDLELSPSAVKKIKEEIQKSEDEANEMIRSFEKGHLAILPGMTAKDSLEAQILNVLASGVSRVSDIVEDNVGYSDIMVMARSGAKGSLINTTQMAAVVGQETILGKRIKRGYLTRTLPHMTPGDLSPRSHGFVAGGFRDGLQPFELFWNIMNGREGLMDKSLRTRKSGYMQRRLIYALQDLKVNKDLSIRNSNGRVIQFLAGEDGIDPSRSHWGHLGWKETIEAGG